MENQDATALDINKPATGIVFEEFIFPGLNVRPIFPDLEALDAALDHLAATKDERALVIVGALLVEGSIDDLLHTIMPGYKALRKKDFAFSTKIELARALRLCPNSVFNAADTVRAMRNAFAHNLPVDAINKLPERDDPGKNLIESMRAHYLEYCNLDFEPGYEAEAFKILVRCMLETLYYCRVQVWLLNQFIRSKELLPALNNFCSAEGIDLNKIGKH